VVTVVNHLRLTEPLPVGALGALEDVFPAMQREGCRACQLVRVADDHLILVLVFDSAEVAATVSSAYGGPWMRDYVRPYLAGDTDRSVGEAIVSLGF